MWIFGYGSLIWRPAFPYINKQVADLYGWERRFWQGSTDHRGTPNAPGRVVTLVQASPSSCCRGMAFHISPEHYRSVLNQLDHREQDGYHRLEIELQTPTARIFPALVYLASETNKQWLGPASPESIAEQVIQSRGASGDNTTYVLELDRALTNLDANDKHVTTIAQEVRHRLPEEDRMLAAKSPAKTESK